MGKGEGNEGRERGGQKEGGRDGGKTGRNVKGR